jgi:hypothetical protein
MATRRRKDPRAFIAIHDDIVNHPKIEPLSDAAFRHLIRLWGYCNKFRTDGIVSEAKVREKGARVFRELTSPAYPGAEPLVIPADGGYWECRDYLKHQWSAEEIQEQAERNRINGSKGGRPPKPKP